MPRLQIGISEGILSVYNKGEEGTDFGTPADDVLADICEGFPSLAGPVYAKIFVGSEVEAGASPAAAAASSSSSFSSAFRGCPLRIPSAPSLSDE